MPLSGASSFSAGRAGILPQPLGRLQKVLVIGAGVSGLQTARQLLKLGVQVRLLLEFYACWPCWLSRGRFLASTVLGLLS